MNHFGSRSLAIASGSSLAVACLLLTAHGAKGSCGDHNRPSAGTLIASWYGRDHHGKPTANGDIFDEKKLTAAHPWLPFGVKVLVTNLANGRSVTVVINDRGPGYGRAIDLSEAAAQVIGMIGRGLAPVRLVLEKRVDAISTGALLNLDAAAVAK